MDTRHPFRHRLLLFVERTSWILGLAGLLWWGAFQIQVARSTRHDLARFAVLQAATLQEEGVVDQTLWSDVRINAWRNLSGEPAAPPVAVLRIPKIGLVVPVLPGTDDRTLDFGVGLIENTPEPGTDGNSGIAGHRDGFFRGLKDIALGDTIRVDTLHGTYVYRIERTWIVKPEDVSVLNPTPEPSLTLVTCYPFYFQGSAPLRFIVRAVREGSSPRRVVSGR
jgi:LPXTG-site transpeptidase (sortase) family protein